MYSMPTVRTLSSKAPRICPRCLHDVPRPAERTLRSFRSCSSTRSKSAEVPSKSLGARGYSTTVDGDILRLKGHNAIRTRKGPRLQPAIDAAAAVSSQYSLRTIVGGSSRRTSPCVQQNRSYDGLYKRFNSTSVNIPKPEHPAASTSDIRQQPEANMPLASSTLSQDASSRLASRSRSLPPNSLKHWLTTYLSLTKPRLTFLMVLTTASAYSLYPVPSVLLSTVTESPSLSALTLVYLTAGTGLCSAAANSFNMIMEPQHDAKMSRTRNRPLVRGLISKKGAIIFAIMTGTAGVCGLYVGVNPTVSFLGALTIFLYAGVYTPLKRISVLNTWVGAVVGAIPPLMGWAAGAGQSATGAGDWKELLFGPDAAGGWLLATLLFAWQFHHFNALSWTVRHEYKHAGYRMLAWVDEAMNARVALRYALLCFPACWGLSIVGVTDWGYVLTSSIVNAWICQAAWRFYKFKGSKGSARGLFWVGVWQLPSLLVLAMAEKKGFWSNLKTRYLGDDGALDNDAFDDYAVSDSRDHSSTATTSGS